MSSVTHPDDVREVIVIGSGLAGCAGRAPGHSAAGQIERGATVDDGH
ncbi:hypothetical protein [Streptomyces sp. NPDC058424]